MNYIKKQKWNCFVHLWAFKWLYLTGNSKLLFGFYSGRSVYALPMICYIKEELVRTNIDEMSQYLSKYHVGNRETGTSLCYLVIQWHD